MDGTDLSTATQDMAMQELWRQCAFVVVGLKESQQSHESGVVGVVGIVDVHGSIY